MPFLHPLDPAHPWPLQDTRPLSPWPAQDAALAAVERQLPEFAPQQLAMLLWGLSAGGLPPSPSLLACLPAAVEQLLWRATESEAVTMLRALVQLGAAVPSSCLAAVVERVVALAQRRLRAEGAVGAGGRGGGAGAARRRGRAVGGAWRGGEGEGGSGSGAGSGGGRAGGDLPMRLALLVLTLGELRGSLGADAAAAADMRAALAPHLPALMGALAAVLPACGALEVVQIARGLAAMRYSPGGAFWGQHQAACLACAGDLQPPMWRQVQAAYAGLGVAPQRAVAAAFMMYV